MHKFLVCIFVLVSTMVFAQMTQVKTGSPISDVPYMELWVTTGGEVVACWLSDDLEQFLATASDLAKQDEQPNWNKVLWDHDCTVLDQGNVVTVLGLTEDWDIVEGEFNGYGFEFEGESYIVLNIDVQEPKNQNIQYAIKSNLNMVRITPGSDMWVIDEFLDANSIEN